MTKIRYSNKSWLSDKSKKMKEERDAAFKMYTGNKNKENRKNIQKLTISEAQARYILQKILYI
jgi:hypothetical protein